MQFNPQPKNLILKLTALWAVSEIGLGGMMHAASIPFSGIFLGSFAVIIVSFLAFHSENRFRTIMQATLLVILVKAVASPHSPVTAYVAVGFQGVAGAVIYHIAGLNRVSAIFYGGVALLESALQKLITLTVIFGVKIWDAVAEFIESIAGQLQWELFDDWPYLVVGLYAGLYVFVGAIAGNFGFILPKKLKNYAAGLIIPENMEEIKFLKKKSGKKFWLIPLALLFSSGVFFFTGNSKDALYILLRTLAALIFFLYIFNPLFRWLLQCWVQKSKKDHFEKLSGILELTPEIRSNANLALQMSKNEKFWFKRAQRFVMNWLSISLYYEKPES